MAKLDVFEQGVYVFRGALDAAWSADMAAEVHNYANSTVWRDMAEDVAADDTVRVDGRAAQVGNRHGILPSLLQRQGYDACARLASLVGDFMDVRLAFNVQDPQARQQFHSDGKVHSVAVAYPEGHGFLDICDYTNEKDTDTEMAGDSMAIPVHMGDLAILTQPNKVHRGRNVGLDPRATIGAYTF